MFQGLDQTAEDKAESHYNRMLTKELSKFELLLAGTPAMAPKQRSSWCSPRGSAGDQTDLGFVTSVNDSAARAPCVQCCS